MRAPWAAWPAQTFMRAEMLAQPGLVLVSSLIESSNVRDSYEFTLDITTKATNRCAYKLLWHLIPQLIASISSCPDKVCVGLKRKLCLQDDVQSNIYLGKTELNIFNGTSSAACHSYRAQCRRQCLKATAWTASKQSQIARVATSWLRLCRRCVSMSWLRITAMV